MMCVVRMMVQPARARSMQQVLHLACNGGIQPGERLIEDQQLRIVDQRAGQRRLLLHAARKTLAALVAMRPQVQPLEQLTRIARRNLRIHAPQAGHELQIFHHRELVVEQRLVRQPGDQLLGHARLGQRIHAEHLDAAGIRLQQSAHHAQCGGLARAIGTQQSVELTGSYGEIDAIHRRPVEGLAQTLRRAVPTVMLPCLPPPLTKPSASAAAPACRSPLSCAARGARHSSARPSSSRRACARRPRAVRLLPNGLASVRSSSITGQAYRSKASRNTFDR